MAHLKRSRAKDRKGMVVTIVALPGPLYRRLRTIGRIEGLALTEMVRRAVAEWIERRGKGGEK
jgi:hypothetical protein